MWKYSTQLGPINRSWKEISHTPNARTHMDSHIDGHPAFSECEMAHSISELAHSGPSRIPWMRDGPARGPRAARETSRIQRMRGGPSRIRWMRDGHGWTTSRLPNARYRRTAFSHSANARTPFLKLFSSLGYFWSVFFF